MGPVFSIPCPLSTSLGSLCLDTHRVYSLLTGLQGCYFGLARNLMQVTPRSKLL